MPTPCTRTSWAWHRSLGARVLPTCSTLGPILHLDAVHVCGAAPRKPKQRRGTAGNVSHVGTVPRPRRCCPASVRGSQEPAVKRGWGRGRGWSQSWILPLPRSPRCSYSSCTLSFVLSCFSFSPCPRRRSPSMVPSPPRVPPMNSGCPPSTAPVPPPNLPSVARSCSVPNTAVHRLDPTPWPPSSTPAPPPICSVSDPSLRSNRGGRC
mmetsp:Transcript_38985/g.93824  ORF Transcript_38985/g.93824 Transcript_38985/m.93824 type:complete len:208 (-) Transcript_38985:1538-2161(-)